ncbi:MULTISPECIES: FISUMP domain-containing protein [Chryseobacterium]|jgi:uncharacterized protein (TIGR02145 family)|uniref:FISUMP domain-containing protein n=1 Tax=Chryseobacterium TaxID=59732 RepID=UPI001CBFD83D|nr:MULTISPECIES: FISUMP domain-containing protein [Chryseobacterium]MDR6466296.1 uncharacterized protein (TIGR02145 family) [Chryseobacterium sediminis]
MKKHYLLALAFVGIVSYSQVGINNTAPKTTLEISSKTSDGSSSEGFLLPKVTGNQLKAAETAGVYANDQDATLVFVTAAPDEGNRTGQVEGMDSKGFYYFDAGSNRWVKMVSSGTITGSVTELLCSNATHAGVLETTSPAAGVSTNVPYTGGNGGIYSALSIPSIGVTGLTAVLPSGTLNNGNGTLVFTITGTPSAAGTATFNIDLFGFNCGFNLTVEPSTSFADVVDVTIDNQTRQMMTHNLGADPTLDPEQMVQGVHGNYYQWGKKAAVATAYTPATSISGWSTTAAANKAWNSGTEAIPVKTTNDPCPQGFRVPTRNEWISFYNNSTVSNVGTFVALPGSATNFGVGKKFVNGTSTLVFPAAGSRNSASINRAYSSDYWSSTESSTNAFSFTFNSNTITPAYANSRTFGFSVRCISEN